MHELVVYVLFYVLIQIKVLAQNGINYYFLSSTINPLCSTNACDGQYNNPYDSFINMLNQGVFQDNNIYYILFLGNENTIHYITLYEQNYYDYRTSTNIYFDTFTNLSLILKAVHCNDPIYSPYYNPGVSTDCLIDNESNMQIEVKSIDFSIRISGNLTMQNLTFNGIDLLYNSNNANDPCLNQRITCCFNEPSSNINCFPAIDMTKSTIQNDLKGVFAMESTNTIQLQGIILESIISISNPSLISLGQSTILNIENCTLNSIYFVNGVISNSMKSISSNITIDNVKLTNYNPLGVASLSGKMPALEGYLINLIYDYEGVILVINSHFENVTNSYMQVDCNENIMFAMMDIQDPYMQPQHIQEFINYSGYSTGIIAISSIKGNLILNNNNFTYISGYSGTVLSIMDIIGTSSSITITNNIFDSNFALINSATIKIIQTLDDSTSNSNFANGVYCQPIIVENNIFMNNWGCPGSSANMIILCNTQLLLVSNTQQSFDLTMLNSTQLADFNALFDSESYILTIQNNSFISNRLVYSNTLLIYGFIGIIIANNTFEDNGVQISSSSMLSFGYQNLEQVVNDMWTNYQNSFGWQSTTVLFVSVSGKLNIANNTFRNNWAVNTSTTLRGSQITIDYNVLMGSSTQFSNNKFENNVGIPVNLQQTSSVYVAVPLITLNMANIDNYLNSLINPPQSQIIFSFCNFLNNEFDYTESYFHAGIPSLDTNNYISMIRIYDENARNIATSGWQDKITDMKIVLLITNSNFVDNTLICSLSSSAFFMANNIIENVMISNSLFKSNIVNSSMVTIPRIPDFVFGNTPSMIGVWNNMKNNDISPSLTISYCRFLSNIGSIFNVNIDPTHEMIFTLNDNVFLKNTLMTNQMDNSGLIIWNTLSVDISMENNTFNSTMDCAAIMLFQKGPVNLNELGSIYGANNLIYGIKYLNYTGLMNQVFQHTVNNCLYTNNIISTISTINGYQVSSLIILASSISSSSSPANQLTYHEENAYYEDNNIQKSLYFILNEYNFTIVNLTMIQAELPSMQCIYAINSNINIMNSSLTGNDNIDESYVNKDIIDLPYAIDVVNSIVNVNSVNVKMFLGALNGYKSTVNITNLSCISLSGGFLSDVTIDQYSYPMLFDFEQSDVSILSSSFSINNGFMLAKSTNILLSNCNFSDADDTAQTSWVSITHTLIDSNLQISNSNMTDSVSKYVLNSSNITLMNSYIWGILKNCKYSFNLDLSTLSMTSMSFDNTYGIMTSITPSNFSLNNINYNTGGLIEQTSIVNSNLSLIN